jgi:hypothetical protein
VDIDYYKANISVWWSAHARFLLLLITCTLLVALLGFHAIPTALLNNEKTFFIDLRYLSK